MRFHDEITKAPPLRRAGTRASVLDCGSPLPLSMRDGSDIKPSHRPLRRFSPCARQSARGLAHSKGFTSHGAQEPAPTSWTLAALCRFVSSAPKTDDLPIKRVEPPRQKT